MKKSRIEKIIAACSLLLMLYIYTPLQAQDENAAKIIVKKADSLALAGDLKFAQFLSDNDIGKAKEATKLMNDAQSIIDGGISTYKTNEKLRKDMQLLSKCCETNVSFLEGMSYPEYTKKNCKYPISWTGYKLDSNMRINI